MCENLICLQKSQIVEPLNESWGHLYFSAPAVGAIKTIEKEGVD